LINDRREETEYLKQLLANSKVKDDGSSVVKFSPQIIRDLKTVDVLSASLGLNIGKSSRTSATDLNNRIQEAKLKAQLAVLEKQIEGIETAKAPEVAIPAPDLSKDLSAASGSETHVLAPDVSKLHDAIKDIQSQLATLAISATAGPTAPSNAYAALADPRDDLIDRQAYRRDIRAALAEAQLDDTHDRGGNALYRLQFQATVLPPDGHTKQWGAARLQIQAPLLTRGEIVAKYYNWLSYITSILSDNVEQQAGLTGARSEHNYNYDRFIAQIGSPDYFTIWDIFMPADEAGTYYCMTREGATDDQLRDIAKLAGGPGLTGRRAGIDPAPGKLFRKFGTYAVPPGIPTSGCASYSNQQNNVFQFARQIPAPDVEFIIGQIKKYSPTSDNYTVTGARKRPEEIVLDRARRVPDDFCLALVGLRASDFCNLPLYAGELAALPIAEDTIEHRQALENEALEAAGGKPGTPDYAIRSYSVLPGELAQRLGVTTEASQSLQTALTVAAQLSASVSAGLDIGRLSQLDARAEAISRQPIVVGFSGTQPNIPQGDRGSGYFGWLFGPQFAIKDSKTLGLQQTVRSYGVNADVSVPGWWSSLKVTAKTVWIQNWASAALMDEGVWESDKKQYSDGGRLVEVTKLVNLPLVDAAYDSLTDFIAANRFGPQNARIFASSVTPSVVPACASLVTFQINGTNIWRANSALLGGVPAKLISVLPHMNGITAQFDMAEVFGGIVNADSTVQDLPLMVSAEQGSAAPLDVYVVGKRQSSNGATTCQSPLIAPANLGALPPTIVSWTPTDVCSAMKSVSLAVHSLNFPETRDDLEIDSNGVFAAKVISTSPTEQVISLRLNDNSRPKPVLLPGIATVALVLKTRDPNKSDPKDKLIRAGQLVLNVKECKSDADKAAADAKKKVTLVTQAVKLAKDQRIEIKGSVPSSYGAIAVAVRPQSKSGDTDWISSKDITGLVPGDGVLIQGSIDLSRLSARVGDKLDVAERIRPRANADWQTVGADKPAVVTDH
jgi:hypothetical protein